MNPRLALLLICAAVMVRTGPAGVGLAGTAQEAITVAEPSGYRMEEYRAPTPATLAGAVVLTTEQARALWAEQQAAFIDVLPHPPRPTGLPASTIWRPKPRFDIPGSIWLPDTGYGALAPVTEAYFESGLAQAAAGDRGRALVFYCLENCWMSWNAAKRAMDLGYAHVAWYRDGMDGWEASGLPTEAREPLPRPSTTE
jgi:PQQ-dependent catabolism-associated CXXCW motif protein